jgi:hypothetical protein
LKRLIGKFLVAVLLAGGAMFVGASPSSAARDVHCMDEQHWLSNVQNLTNSYVDAAAVLSNWQNAYYYYDSFSGSQVWQADVLGVTQQVYFLSDYNTRVGAALTQANSTHAQLDAFVDTYYIC